jgi:2-polyprenyl-3-methyl-5-hydroxy-6-metoxy-1,4-benzoquinol methylase
MIMDKQHRADTGRSYRGIPIHAANGLHEYVLSQVKNYGSGIKNILELGAGSGALTCRLTDEGYTVVPVDLDGKGWSYEKISPRLMDLNSQNWDEQISGEYDAVIAVEIIEHLENPRQFIEKLYSRIRPGGKAIITTPNVMCGFSKLLMFKRDALYGFDEHQYYRSGHMSILPYWLMEIMAVEAGFEVENLVFVGAIDDHVGWLQRLAIKTMRLIGSVIGNKVKNTEGDGVITVLLLSKQK